MRMENSKLFVNKSESRDVISYFVALSQSVEQLKYVGIYCFVISLLFVISGLKVRSCKSVSDYFYTLN